MVSKNVRVIGIDLGTTYSSVGFWIGEELKIRKIPSCVAFTDYSKEPVVGDEAFDGVDKNPSNTILDIKRLIGVKFSDNRTKQDVIDSPFEVISNPVSKNDVLSVVVRSFNRLKTVSAEMLLGMILKKLKQIAEEEILGLENGDVIINAVIIVPSCYNNAQRLATKVAAKIAGFGSSHFNDLLYRHCSCHYNNSFRLRSKSSLRFACENAKKNLSDPNVREAKVKFLKVSTFVTQDVFHRECKELFDKCQEAIAQCLQVSGISQFHQVILVGGSTRIPRIREMLRAFCGDERVFCEILEPDIAVVQGAALQAAVWSGEEALSNLLLDGISIADVAPISLKTLTMPNLIPRNTEIPIVIRLHLTTARNNQRRFCFGVHEGEEVIVEDNNLIGHFIFVSFAVDHDGILNVTAAEVAEDGSRRRQLARRVINRILTTDELNEFERDMENPEQEESKRKKIEAKMQVWLFVTKHMSREVPDDFSVGFSATQEEMLRQALADAKGWLINGLPEVRDSELYLEELQRRYFLILHDDGENLREYQKKLFQQKMFEKFGYDITEDMLQI
ncbi:hypothetical protein MKW98_009635 [Papaver atlanticum]|uniref:Uncharacterized protein n=1 Tax=Papaver atlanticum TaxID=357466 RepID=A0AAD4SEZ1_9MAGN|nr:hypothetical protein MKW98_009635 [Papaver atlanticum]